MRSNFIIWSLLYLFRLGIAQKVGVKSPLGLACISSALKYDFGCPKVYLPLNCPCGNTDFLVTVMDCVMKHSRDVVDTAKALKYARDQCHYWGNHTMRLADMQQLYAENRHLLVASDSYDDAEVGPGPVVIPDEIFEPQLVTAKNGAYHYYVGDCFAWGTVGYWAFVVVAGILANLIRIMWPEFYNFIGFKRATWIRKHLTLPAFVGYRHQSPWKLLFFNLHMPTRGQTLIVIGAVGINIASIVSFLGTKGPTPFLWSSHSDRVLHYLANRTGIIAFAHIPLLVLFACRNNPLIYLTGWPYNTFMIYHRWCARFMGIHAVIHSVAMYWTSFNEHVVVFKWREVHNWQAGNIAVYMAIFMLVFSLRAFRSRFYEFFKATHVVMFWIFIVCVVVHCSDYGWLGWIWASFVFYGIEYAGRIARIVISGGVQEAEFTSAEPESNLYRIKVAPGRRRWAVRPGAYVYILVIDKDMFWQFHPFSVFQSFNNQEDGTLNFCVRAQDGATRTILQKIVASNGTLKRKVLIEGPYGQGNYVSDYDSVLLFAGGVGFTAMYAYALRLMRRLEPTQHLCLIWVIRDVSNLRAVQKEVSYLYSNHGHTCDFRIFITRPGEIENAWAGFERRASTSDLMSRIGGYVTDAQQEIELEDQTEELEAKKNQVTVNAQEMNSEESSPRTSDLPSQEPEHSTVPTEHEKSIKQDEHAVKAMEEVDIENSQGSRQEGSHQEGSHSARNSLEGADNEHEATADSGRIQRVVLDDQDVQVDGGATEPTHPRVENASSENRADNSKVHNKEAQVTEETRTRSEIASGEKHQYVNNIAFRRPNIRLEVSEFIKNSYGRKSICSCGPPMFVDSIREGVVQSIFESPERVDYFEDAFSW